LCAGNKPFLYRPYKKRSLSYRVRKPAKRTPILKGGGLYYFPKVMHTSTQYAKYLSKLLFADSCVAGAEPSSRGVHTEGVSVFLACRFTVSMTCSETARIFGENGFLY
jgi:hypothetical protein